MIQDKLQVPATKLTTIPMLLQLRLHGFLDQLHPTNHLTLDRGKPLDRFTRMELLHHQTANPSEHPLNK